MKGLKFLLPLLIFGGIAVTLYVGLQKDPRKLPSMLIDKPLPDTKLPLLEDPTVFVESSDLIGQPALINIWATWCVSCRAEHEVLMHIAAKDGVAIYGIDYKDDKAKAEDWLKQLGNPYLMNLADPTGRLALDFGIYGTPETFLIDKDGIVKYRHPGPISLLDWEQRIKPMWRALQ